MEFPTHSYKFAAAYISLFNFRSFQCLYYTVCICRRLLLYCHWHFYTSSLYSFLIYMAFFCIWVLPPGAVVMSLSFSCFDFRLFQCLYYMVCSCTWALLLWEECRWAQFPNYQHIYEELNFPLLSIWPVYFHLNGSIFSFYSNCNRTFCEQTLYIIDQAPCSAISDMGLNCLHMSSKIRFLAWLYTFWNWVHTQM